jgi:hypothetical protein
LREFCLIGGVGSATVVFVSLDKMKEMRKLRLHNVLTSDESMQQLIGSMSHLELLELKGVRGLTSAALLSGNGLGELVRLETLSLPSSIMNDEVIGKMHLSKLRKLCLFKQKVGSLKTISQIQL